MWGLACTAFWKRARAWSSSLIDHPERSSWTWAHRGRDQGPVGRFSVDPLGSRTLISTSMCPSSTASFRVIETTWKPIMVNVTVEISSKVQSRFQFTRQIGLNDEYLNKYSSNKKFHRISLLQIFEISTLFYILFSFLPLWCTYSAHILVKSTIGPIYVRNRPKTWHFFISILSTVTSNRSKAQVKNHQKLPSEEGVKTWVAWNDFGPGRSLEKKISRRFLVSTYAM